MSILVKIGIGIGAAMLIVASICVTIAALFPPKEYKGGGKVDATSGRHDASIEDV